jgi:hypothetical protein
MVSRGVRRDGGRRARVVGDLQHRGEQVTVLSDPLQRHGHPEVAWAETVLSSSHRNGVDTGGPGFGRTE